MGSWALATSPTQHKEKIDWKVETEKRKKHFTDR